MADIIELREHGGPAALTPATRDLPAPGAGELRVRQLAIGVNYHDVYVRSGLYRTLTLPGVPGIEAVGIVDAVGPGVTGFTIGDRIGYVTGGYGAYASARNLPAEIALKLPDSLSDAQAAATLMKGLTTAMLVRHVHRVQAGETILVHAAAGGMGQLITRWASHLGAMVIGTVGDRDKGEIARGAGAAEIILYRDEDVSARVAAMTAGAGVAAVYDSVGADTFDGSIASLGFGGHLVSFGQASGPVAPFSLGLLATRSLTVSRPIIFHYLREAAQREALAAETFAALAAGAIRPIDPVELPLAAAADAHDILEARKSPGGIVLIP